MKILNLAAVDQSFYRFCVDIFAGTLKIIRDGVHIIFYLGKRNDVHFVIGV
jgi:hypothetical protein